MTTSAENKVSDRRSGTYPRCTHIVNTHVVHLLTCAEYDDLLAMARGCCMLCRRSDAPLCVDHDHELGPWAVRGLVCRGCNQRLRRVDSGEKEATVSIAEYLANPWHLHQPSSALKKARMRPRADCVRCGQNVAIAAGGGLWRHWSRLPGEAFEILCTGTPSRLTPAATRPAPVLVQARIDAGNLAWARSEAQRRGQPFGDYIDGLITAERGRVDPEPDCPHRLPPGAWCKTCKTAKPEGGKR